MAPEPQPSRWHRVEELFHHAASLPPAARPAYLDRTCADDPDLRLQIEDLLRHDEHGLTLFAHAIGQAAADVAETRQQRWIGQRLGPWLITGILGHGGMGVVYRVERADGAYTQQAALKILHGDLDTPEHRRRFAVERQILAQLKHPQIAALLDGGATGDGSPYLVMELVDGLPIHEYATERALALDERIPLMATVCRAVHAAHQRLVIHRDLKPTNILIQTDGTVKLLDFGIARLLEPDAASAHTRGADLHFSPPYASPEQVRGEPMSTATDIYSLGAVLFHLLTDKAPRELTTGSVEEIYRVVCERPFPLPSAAAPPPWKRKLRGDLDTVVQTATAPDVSQRYASAEQFAADLDRYLAGEPLLARPPRAAYRFRKFLQRHLVAVPLVATAVLALVASTAYSTVQARRAERRFEQVRRLANTFLFDFHDQIRDLQGSTAARESVARTALTYLNSLAAEARGDRSLELELAAAYDKVAAVQWGAGTASLGRPQDAQASYRRAIAIREPWLAREWANAPLHAQQAASYLALAESISGRDGLERVTAAYTKALEHGEAAHQLEQPPSVPVLALLARLHHARAVTASRAGQLDRAVDSYAGALAVRRELAVREPTADRHLAVAQEQAGLALGLYNASRQREAQREYRASVAALEIIARAHPDNRRYRRALFQTCFTYGGVLMNPMLAIYSPSEAETLFRRALELAQVMAQDTQDFNAQRDLAAAHCQVGSALAETNPLAAVKAYEAGISTFRRIQVAAPDQKALDRALAMHLPGYAGALAALKRRTALDEARHAVTIAQRFLQADPHAVQAQRLLLTTSLALAETQLTLGESDAVPATLEPARAIAEAGPLERISQSLLHDRTLLYALLCRAAAPTPWRSRFDEAARECERRNLGGPFLARQRRSLGISAP